MSLVILESKTVGPRLLFKNSAFTQIVFSSVALASFNKKVDSFGAILYRGRCDVRKPRRQSEPVAFGQGIALDKLINADII